jgi:hypothetical protein
MRNIVTSQQIYPVLQALLGLPDLCTRFELRVAHNQAVTVECEYYPSLDVKGIAQLTAVLGEYELVRRETPVGAPAQSLDWYAWAHEADPLLQGMPYDAWVCHRAGVAHAAEAIGFDAWMRERTEVAHHAFMKTTGPKPAPQRFATGGDIPGGYYLVGEK